MSAVGERFQGRQGGCGGNGSQKRSTGENGGNEEYSLKKTLIVFFVLSVGSGAPFLKSGTSMSLRSSIQHSLPHLVGSCELDTAAGRAPSTLQSVCGARFSTNQP